MSSFRSRSLERGALSEATEVPKLELARSADTPQYEPHLFDLVYAADQLKNEVNINVQIPLGYTQAASVDSAKFVGHGASFIAAVRSLPPGPAIIQNTISLGEGVTVTQSRPAPPTPRHVLYKTARIAFADNGLPNAAYKKALQNVLTELHALTHPHLFQHPNIIAFLGLAWGTNEFDVTHRLPALMIEYAEFGDLRNVYRKQKFSGQIAQSFCYDIASGLQCLHTAGLVHGDIKAENVLICQGAQRMVAKLGDFGYSIAKETESGVIWIGGTRPWMAPETAAPIPVDRAAYTDVYSLGLLIWSVSMGCVNPFLFVLEEPTSQAIEDLKASDGVLAFGDPATLMNRSLHVFAKRFPEQKSRDTETVTGATSVISDISQVQPHVSPPPLIPPTNDTIAGFVERFSRVDVKGKVGLLGEPTFQEKMLPLMLEKHELLSKMGRIFSCSLGLDPLSRNLDALIEILRPGVVVAEPHFTRDHKQNGPTKTTIFNGSGTTRTFRHTASAERVQGHTAAEKLRKASLGLEWNNEATSAAGSSEGKPCVQARDQISTSSLGESTTSHPENPRASTSQEGDLTIPVNAPAPSMPENLPDKVIQESEPPKKTSWTMRGLKSTWHNWQVAWQPMRNLSPGLQDVIYRTLKHPSQLDHTFLQAAATMNGYGCPKDTDQALALLRQCADAGHLLARAYVYRLHKACGVFEVAGYDLTQYLDRMARIGARAAQLDLHEAGLCQGPRNAAWWTALRTGGVGADWFADINMLHGFNLGNWLDHKFLTEQVAKLDNVNTHKINKHGDTLLHTLACCVLGNDASVRFLLEEAGADINCRNSAGDTPLISVCRASIAPTALTLLRTYKADASLAAQNGETALHWLVKFPDDWIESLANEIIKAGAFIDAATTTTVSHSLFRGIIDCEFQPPGTALQWAVHSNRPRIVALLLLNGADPRLISTGGRLSPLAWAAHFHRAECLELMIHHLEKQHRESGGTDDRTALFYGPLVTAAIHSADTFSMILRNGHRYLDQLYATLNILKEKTRLINIENNAIFSGATPIYYAAMEAHDEVVSYILEENWNPEDFDKPCGDNMRTPLLEAVRWNRFWMTLQLSASGADVRVKARNPFDYTVYDWSALHVLADEGFSDCNEMLTFLVESGCEVDDVLERLPQSVTASHQQGFPNESGGRISLGGRRGETAFSCALRNNAFGLCNGLLSLGADPNALSTTAGFFAVEHLTTVLGHVIVSNARHIYHRLKFLLDLEQTSFIVEPKHALTALHRAAIAFQGVSTTEGSRVRPEDFDWDVNRATMRQLLTKYASKEQINARCLVEGATALHLAVAYGSPLAVEVLLDADADAKITDDNGRYPGDLLDLVPGKPPRIMEMISKFNLPKAPS